MTDETTTAESTEPPETTAEAPVEPPLVEEELLVEDVSIDGMCGVY